MRTETVTRVLDVPFAAPGGHELLVDLYLPSHAGPRIPTIIWLHGGGWRHGDRKLGPDLARHFASRGFAMVSPDYRLSTQAVFPAQVEDVKTAIRWVRRGASTYGLDADAIGLFGSSAGGHLALIAALSAPGQFEGPDGLYAHCSSHVQAVVAGYAPVDFLSMDAQRTGTARVDDDLEAIRLPTDARSVDADSFESALIGAPIESRPDLVRRANPVTYVAPTDVPFLILHGRSDHAVPLRQSRVLYDALAAHGNTVTLCLIDGLGHGFLNRTDLDKTGPRAMSIQAGTAAGTNDVSRERRLVFPLVEEFFRKHLAGPNTRP